MLVLLALLATSPDPGLQEGRYALVMRIVTAADAAVVGKVTTTTTTTALVDVVTRADGATFAQQRACSMVTDGGLFKARGAPGFVRAMAPVTYQIHVEGTRFTADLGIAGVAVPLGSRSLPEAREAFTDPDKDGNVGAPLDVELAGMTLRLDVASVGHAVLEGTLREDGKGANGKPRVLFSDERILGGPAFATGGTKEVVAALSTFELLPLAQGATRTAVAQLEATKLALR